MKINFTLRPRALKQLALFTLSTLFAVFGYCQKSATFYAQQGLE